jgi:hypothetical protein
MQAPAIRRTNSESAAKMIFMLVGIGIVQNHKSQEKVHIKTFDSVPWYGHYRLARPIRRYCKLQDLAVRLIT